MMKISDMPVNTVQTSISGRSTFWPFRFGLLNRPADGLISLVWLVMLLLTSCGDKSLEVNFFVDGREKRSSDVQPSLQDSGAFYTVNQGESILLKDATMPRKKVKNREWRLGDLQVEPVFEDQSAVSVVLNSSPNSFKSLKLCVNKRQCVTKWIFVKENFAPVESPITLPDKPIVRENAVPVYVGVPGLKLDGKKAIVSGLSNGKYLLFFTVNGEEKEQIIQSKNQQGIWELPLAADKVNRMVLKSIQRISDKLTEYPGLVAEYGTATPSYRPGFHVLGWTKPGDISACPKMRWVESGSCKITPPGPAELEYGYVYLEEKGRVEIELLVSGEKRRITRELLKGENKVSFYDLYPSLPAQETAVLTMKGLDTRIADMLPCYSAAAPTGNWLSYSSGVAIVGNIRMRLN